MKELKALYIIVNAGFADEIVAIARSLGATGATIMNARGTVANPKTIMGISIDKEKEIVVTIVDKTTACNIMEQVKQKAGINTTAHGLCFFLPVELSTLALNNAETDSK